MSIQMLQRSVRLYPVYAFCSSAHFWQPIFFLYFMQHLSLAEVLRLEAVYYVAVVVLEVPSGYFSDVVGRRITLIISSASTAFACSLFLVGDSFWIFACAQMALATGMAFRSGTDTSFHYDLLFALDRADEYDGRESLVARNAFVGAAIAALVGGLVASYALSWAYALSLGVACVALLIAICFRDPPRAPSSVSPWGFVIQVRDCFQYLQSPLLAWLMGFVIFMTVVNHIPYEFYQPYIGLLNFQNWASTPVVTGFHTALTLFVAGCVARYSIFLRDRMGLGGTLLFAAGLQITLIALMAIYLHPFIALLLMLRSSPRALMTAPLNAAIVPRLEKVHRATYLSIQSLLGRLAFGGVLLALSVYAGQTASWQALSLTLTICFGFGFFGFVGLAFLMRLSFQAEGVWRKDRG